MLNPRNTPNMKNLKLPKITAYVTLFAILVTSFGCHHKTCAAYGGAIDKVKVGRHHRAQSGLFPKGMKR